MQSNSHYRAIRHHVRLSDYAASVLSTISLSCVHSFIFVDKILIFYHTIFNLPSSSWLLLSDAAPYSQSFPHKYHLRLNKSGKSRIWKRLNNIFLPSVRCMLLLFRPWKITIFDMTASLPTRSSLRSLPPSLSHCSFDQTFALSKGRHGCISGWLAASSGAALG